MTAKEAEDGGYNQGGCVRACANVVSQPPPHATLQFHALNMEALHSSRSECADLGLEASGRVSESTFCPRG